MNPVPSQLLKVAASACLALLAVVASADPVPRNVQFEHITDENGLSHAGITAIAQDQHGFMWIGTQEGLNRFDGHEVTTFTHDRTDPDSIASGWVWSMLAEDNGDLWVGTNSGGLSRYSGATGKFVNYRSEPEDLATLRSNLVRVVFRDAEGNLWVGTKGGGLSLMDQKGTEFVHFRHDPRDELTLPSDVVNDIFEWNNTLFIGTGEGLAVLDPGKQTFSLHKVARGLNVRAVAEFQGCLWVGTHNAGIFVFNPVDESVSRYQKQPGTPGTLPSNLIRDFMVDHQSTLWIATDQGLVEWSQKDRGFVTYAHSNRDNHSLSDNRISSIFVDAGNVLWVGTYDGLNRWNYVSDAFRNYNQASGHLNNNIVNAIAESPGGDLYVGTYEGGINRLKVTGGYVSHEDSSRVLMPDQRIMALVSDVRGELWVGTRTDGLYHIDGEGTVLSHHVHDGSDFTSIGADGVTSILAEEESVWVGTYGGGLNRLNLVTGNFTRFQNQAGNPASISSDRVLTVFRDRQGTLWVGTEEGGVNRFNPLLKTFTRIQNDVANPQSLSGDTAWEIFESRDGSLWIGTLGAGLNRWLPQDRARDIPVFRRYSRAEGLRGETVYGVLEDSAGRIWISSNQGLAQVEPDSGSIRYFDRRNGLLGNEFNFGARLRSRSGRIMFGGSTGIVTFDPRAVTENTNLPNIALSASVNRQRRIKAYSDAPASDILELDYRDKVVDFQFAALDYASPDKNRYMYKLEGFDEAWLDSFALRHATYTNLAPGDYVFRVRASNNDGFWNEDGLEVPIHVTPPPWLTIWAYLLYGMVALGSVYFYVSAQRRRLATEARLRIQLEREVSERTEQLGERNAQLESANEQLTEASMSDALTGLHNRRFLYEYLESNIAEIHRYSTNVMNRSDAAELIEQNGSMFFMMIDLDGFKVVNDTYGHPSGDRALLQVTEILRAQTRDSDVVIRWGGDEFLIAGRSESYTGLELLAERIRAGIADHDYLLGDGNVGFLSCSIGFSRFPFNSEDPRQFTWEEVVKLTDRASYVAKHNGKDAWVGLCSADNTSNWNTEHFSIELQDLINSGKINLTTSIDRRLSFIFKPGDKVIELVEDRNAS